MEFLLFGSIFSILEWDILPYRVERNQNEMQYEPPEIKTLRIRPFPTYEFEALPNGAQLVVVREPSWKVFRIEVCFLAGRPYELQRGAAKATADLILEGSQGRSSLTIAETIESYGASISIKGGVDTTHVIMHGPTHYFTELWQLLQDILWKPSFDEKEWKKYQRIQKERILSDLMINEVVSYRKFTEDLFGPNHPYGYNSMPQTYFDLSTDDLKVHFDRCYGAKSAMVLCSGGIDSEMKKRVRADILSWREGQTPPVNLSLDPVSYKTNETTRSLQYQASIRLGKVVIPHTNPDYPYLLIANTILGGYFGSRLMKAIREREGLSYHISSNIETMKYASYWMIGTETSISNINRIISLIQEEINAFVTEEISPKERQMIRNYMIGSSNQFFEGAFQKADFLRHYLFELDQPDLYRKTMDAISEMDGQRIKEVAVNHLSSSDWISVIMK